MAIKTYIFNWFASPENGDEHQRATVGEKFSDSIVRSIHEHLPQGEGDKCYYDIELESGEKIRNFNPNTVLFDAEEPPF